jgi:hypothetical protein
MQTYYFYPCSDEFPISQQFGENPGAYRQYGLAGHNGLDIALPVGRKVYVAGDGVVTVAETHGTSSYGRQVRIQHEEALTIYAHLSRLNVEVGQAVKAKDVIGWSGGAVDDLYAGNTTGPHLHFEIRPAAGGVPGYNGAANPLPLLRGHDYNPSAVPIYQVQVVAQQLNIRIQPDITSRVVALVGKGCEFSVLEEIYKENRLWLRLQAPYARYLCAEENGMIYARRLLTYSSNPAGTGWAESVTVFLKSIGYTGPEPQVEKGSTSWQSL